MFRKVPKWALESVTEDVVDNETITEDESAKVDDATATDATDTSTAAEEDEAVTAADVSAEENADASDAEIDEMEEEDEDDDDDDDNWEDVPEAEIDAADLDESEEDEEAAVAPLEDDATLVDATTDVAEPTTTNTEDTVATDESTDADAGTVDTSIDVTANSSDTSAELDVVDETTVPDDVAVAADTDNGDTGADTLSVNKGNEEMPAMPSVDDAGAVTSDTDGDTAGKLEPEEANASEKGGAGADFIKGGENVDPNTTPLVQQLISFDGDALPITAVAETAASAAMEESADKAEQDGLDQELDDLTEDTAAVEAIAIAAMEALHSGGMSEVAYRSNLATLRRKCDRWGVDVNTVGMESISSNRMTATREMADLANIACEGLLQKSAEWIGQKMQSTTDAIKKIVNGTATMNKYHGKYKDGVDKVTYAGNVEIPWSAKIVDATTGFVIDADGQAKFITASKLGQFDFKSNIDVNRFSGGVARKIAKKAVQQITKGEAVNEEAYVIPGGIMAYTHKGALKWELITRNATKTAMFGDIYRVLKFFEVRSGVKRNNNGEAAYTVDLKTVEKLLANTQLAINAINTASKSWAKIENDSKNAKVDGTGEDSDKTKEVASQYSNMSSVYRMSITAYRNIARGNLEIARMYLRKVKKAAKKAEKASMGKLNALVEETKASTKPATNEQITAAQTALGMKFSDEYRTYLSEFGTIVHESTELYGLGMSDSSHLNIVKAVKTFKEVCDFPKNLIPLAEISDGNYYVYDNSGKKVLTFNQSTLETKSYGSGLEQVLINIVFK